MLSIQPPTSTSKTITPNILPCSINHNGPIPTSDRYWSPKPDVNETGTETGTSTAYFRGRKLRSRTVKVPAGYQGVVLQKTDQTFSTQSEVPSKQLSSAALAEQLRRMEEDYGEEGEDEERMELDGEKEADVKVLETTATFDEVVIWGHEMVPEDEDVYVKGVEEWIGFAEAMHSYDIPAK